MAAVLDPRPDAGAVPLLLPPTHALLQGFVFEAPGPATALFTVGTLNGTLSVPVRSTCSGGAVRRWPWRDRPVATTVTRTSSPSSSSYAVP